MWSRRLSRSVAAHCIDQDLDLQSRDGVNFRIGNNSGHFHFLFHVKLRHIVCKRWWFAREAASSLKATTGWSMYESVGCWLLAVSFMSRSASSVLPCPRPPGSIAADPSGSCCQISLLPPASSPPQSSNHPVIVGSCSCNICISWPNFIAIFIIYSAHNQNVEPRLPLRMNRRIRPRPRSLPAAPFPAPPFGDSAGHKNGQGANSPWIHPDRLPLAAEDVHQWITTTDVAQICPSDYVKRDPISFNLYPPGQDQEISGYNDPLGRWNINSTYPFYSEVLSTFSADALSSVGSTFSPVQTEQSESSIGPRRPCPSPLGKSIGTEDADEQINDKGIFELADYQKLVCLGPKCHLSFQSDTDLRTHVQAVHTYKCSWAACLHPCFASRQELAWHVKAEHLLICPVLECSEQSFQSNRELSSHIAVEHPNFGKNAVKEWELLPPAAGVEKESCENTLPLGSLESTPTKPATNSDSKLKAAVKELMSVTRAKKRCQEQLWNVVEKKARKNAGMSITASKYSHLSRLRLFICVSLY